MDNGGNFLGGVLHSMCKCRNMLVLGLCRSTRVEVMILKTQHSSTQSHILPNLYAVFIRLFLYLLIY